MVLGSNGSNSIVRCSKLICEKQKGQFEIRMCFGNFLRSLLRIYQYSLDFLVSSSKSVLSQDF